MIAQAGHHLQHFLDDQGRQAQRGFIEHQQPWLGHQGTANGQHLPLAARERGGHLRSALFQAREDGKHLLHASVLVALALAPQREAAQQQVVFHRHLAKQLALFRHQPQAARHHGFYRRFGYAFTIQPDFALGWQQAHGRRKQSGLARAIGADHCDDFSGLHAQIDLVHGFHRPIGNTQAA